MCNFASSVITADREFFLPTEDSHSTIIRHFGLHEWGTHDPNIVKVEITPNKNMTVFPSLDTWTYRVDQDKFPEWHTANPADTERRARAALKLRAKRGFKVVELNGTDKLVSLTLPKRIARLNVNGARLLKSVVAPGAKQVSLYGVPNLEKLTVPNATKYVSIVSSKKLTKLALPKADTVEARGNPNLQYLSAAVANCVDARNNKNLAKIYAPKATRVYVTGCLKNVKIKAKKGASIYRGTGTAYAK
jgi:hypothetical protein